MSEKIYPTDQTPETPGFGGSGLDTESLLKLLLDEDRLAILGLTAQRPSTVREMAEMLPAMRNPPAKHVSHLLDAGLLSVVGADSYALNVRQIQQWKRDLFARAKQQVPESTDDQVLATYVRGGKMVQYPAQQNKRLVLLRWLASPFERGRAYPEREVNEILSGHSEDYATLRRYLVDYGYLTREDGIYQRPAKIDSDEWYRDQTMLTIAFDADDTLWHNESLFAMTQGKFRDLLAHYGDSEWIDKQLYVTETRNLTHFGYGIKGFTLSMIETAIELTNGRIGGHEIKEIVEWGRTMLASPVELLPGVEEVVSYLGERYRLLLITKGDFFDQESKLARSGLRGHFQHVEIVHEKDAAIYAKILEKHNISAGDFLMVGNSMRSDILPVLTIGGKAAHIPYAITWQHEVAALPDTEHNGYYPLESMSALPALVAQF